MGLCKIGISVNPEKRLGQLQTGNANEIAILTLFESFYANKIEKTLHRKYKHLNKGGEWFELTFEQIQSFKNDCTLIENNLKVLEMQDDLL
jgi:hypothetical protein